MADDWQPGDLALCIRSGHWINTRTQQLVDLPVRSGMVFTVLRVRIDERGAWLTFDTPTVQGRFRAKRFRKIKPHERDAEDEETIRLLNGVSQPKEIV